MKGLKWCIAVCCCASAFGCSVNDSPVNQPVTQEVTDAEIIANVILLQYGRELHTWKSSTPKMTE